MKNPVILTAYGSGAADQGVIVIDEEKDGGNTYIRQILPIDGKCNFCIQVQDRLYASVQRDKPYLLEFQYDGGAYFQTGSCPTRHFYSHGTVCEGLLFLASFSDGVDAIYDMDQNREIDFHVHERTGYSDAGRSHYIGATYDLRHIYAVDNALQQIYLYDIVNRQFAVRDIREFGEENIRLMPYSSYSDCYYLNTELTNRIYVLKLIGEEFHIRSITDLKCRTACSSGGNAVSVDGRRLCVTTRGDNYLHYFRILPGGDLELLVRTACKEMPRDVLFQEDRLYVTCTDSDAVEVYDIGEDTLEKINELYIGRPVAFSQRGALNI